MVFYPLLRSSPIIEQGAMVHDSWSFCVPL